MDSVTVTDLQNSKELKTLTGNNNPDFTVYPNPAHDQITIQSTGKAPFILTNQSDKTIIIKIINNNGTMDVSHLSDAVYLLTNTTTGKAQKLIISR